MHDDADETIERIAAALRTLPDVDPAHKARVLVAVAAERERTRQRSARTSRVIRVLGAGASLVAAGLVGALWLRDDATQRPAAVAVIASVAPRPVVLPPVATAAAQLATEDVNRVALQPVPLVLRAPAARRVSVVGDFNGWKVGATTMTRDPATGMWSGTLALRPGRHVYAFVVDDSVWMRDPRSPAAADADFGRPGSVLLVGRP
ncbi:MAG: isoamylase early set domain-containing protein [bacterium]